MLSVGKSYNREQEYDFVWRMMKAQGLSKHVVGARRRSEMPAQCLVPAAKYVRMSTTDKKSISSQSAAKQQHATANGYDLVATYTDLRKSGVSISSARGPNNSREELNWTASSS
jgi:hypothetical protein